MPVQVPIDAVIAKLKTRFGSDAVELAILSAQSDAQDARISELEQQTAGGTT